MLFPHWPSSSLARQCPSAWDVKMMIGSNRSSFLCAASEAPSFLGTIDLVKRFSDYYVTFTVSSLLFGFLSLPQ